MTGLDYSITEYIESIKNKQERVDALNDLLTIGELPESFREGVREEIYKLMALMFLEEKYPLSKAKEQKPKKTRAPKKKAAVVEPHPDEETQSL